MKTRLAMLARALSPFHSRVTLGALAVAALMPLAARATDPVWAFDATLLVPSTGNTVISSPALGTILSTATGYGPSVNFEQDVVIHEDGTFDVETYLNGQPDGPTLHPASDASSSFPGAGDYYCDINLSKNYLLSPLLDGNGDPYIELYDGSTGDGYQVTNFSPLDGSHSATLDSSNDITVSFSGIIHFDDSNPWGTILNWYVHLYVQ